MEYVCNYLQKAHQFENEAHQILSKQESSHSRIISLDQTRKQIKELSLKQDELMQQALACVEARIFRASIVMAWAGFMDYLEQQLSSIGIERIVSIRPAWVRYSSIDEIRENIPEYQLIEVARDLKIISKSEAKTIQGLLSKRNECAHPSDYWPNLNESLGYISELINRIEKLAIKK